MAADAVKNDYVDLSALDRTGILGNLSDQFNEAEAEIIEQNKVEDAEAEARTANAHGELYQFPVAIASNSNIEEEVGGTVAAGVTRRSDHPSERRQGLKVLLTTSLVSIEKN